MVWHIFKKDWKLMWRSAAAVAALQMASTIIRLQSELGGGNPILQQLGQSLLLLWLMASVILIVTIVHQDALPGTRQDWLTRPVRRKDLLIEKILFAFVMVQGATILSDMVQGLGSGFSFWQTAGAALVRAVTCFIAITLPALALGAVTQSIAEAMVMSVVFFSGAFMFIMIAIGIGGGYSQQFDPTNLSGVEWLTNLVRFVLVLLGAAIVLMGQYRTRKTNRGRVLMGVVLLIGLCTRFLPWKPVFAIEIQLSKQPGAAKDVAMAWQPHANQTENLTSANTMTVTQSDQVRLRLPLSVSGIPQDSVLKADKSEVVLSGGNGKRLYQGTGDDVEIRMEGEASGSAAFDQTVKIPDRVYQALKSGAVRSETSYSMTLFKLQASYSIPAVDGDRTMPGWGRCTTKINGADTAVEMNCMQMGKGPTCATVFLEDVHNGARNPVNTACYPNYSPYLERPLPDAVSRFRLILPLQDSAGITKLPVDGSRVAGAHIVIRLYEPQDHFTRTVTSPLVRIQDLVIN